MTEKKKESGELSRRDFVAGTGAVLIGGAAGAIAGSAVFKTETETVVETEKVVEVLVDKVVEVPVIEIHEVEKEVVVEKEVIVEVAVDKEVPIAYPLSQGYIVVDSIKCCGCQSCMLACSLVHEGKDNPTYSRIQVTQNALRRFPEDAQINQCRQCVEPICVKVCPTDSLHVDTANGNVRVIDESLCIGCQLCIQACPFIPHRTIWNDEKNVAMKCDLCLDTPFWNETGGPSGKQACVEICPQHAIAFTSDVPIQTDDAGYDINLRT